MTDSKELTITEQGNNIGTNFLSILKSEEYPAAIRQDLDRVFEIIKAEKSVVDLYPEILAEVSTDTSIFQTTCVALEDHFTPHRKLRQLMLDIKGKLGALYAAKTGHKRTLVKLTRIEYEIENLADEIAAIDAATQLLSDPQQIIENNKDIRRLKLALIEKEIDLEEAKRNVDAAVSEIKDCALKVAQHEHMIERYKKEVQESGIGFEESEAIYYVMYFTKDAEKQIRTAGRVDTGTYGAIGQLPKGLRLKVLRNIDFIFQKVEEGHSLTADYLYHIYWDEMIPQMTDRGEWEGVNIKEFINIDTIKLLSKDEMIDCQQSAQKYMLGYGGN